MTSHNATSFSLSGFGVRQVILDVIITLILVALILFAIVGNVLVVMAVVLDTNLRRTGNYFVVSLACADTLVALVVMTFALINDLLGRWVFGDVVCRLWMSADVMCSTASILSLCSVGLDRWVHVRRPLHYERWMTSRRALAAVLFVWVLSTLISFVPIHLDWHVQRHQVTSPINDDVDQRSTNTTSQDGTMTSSISPYSIEQLEDCTMALNSTYAIASSLVSFYVPCLVMVFIYIKMYRYARFHAVNIRRITAIAGVCAATSSRVVGGGLLARHRMLHMSEHKAAVTLGVIMGVFLFCWAPFFTVNVISAVWPSSIDRVVFTICSWLGYLNSSMNPVIYCVFNQDFRIAFKRILLSVPPPRTFSFRTAAAASTTADRQGLTYSSSAGNMETITSRTTLSITTSPVDLTPVSNGPTEDGIKY